MVIKRRYLLSLLILSVAYLTTSNEKSMASEVQITSDTLVRVFERDTTKKNDVLVVPAYEYLRLDAGALSTKGLSFHIYGWGRADLGDGDFFKDDTAGELLYGYLEYTRAENNLNLRLGRQYIFEGVANEAVDGVRVSSDLGPYFTVSAYGGYPAALDSTDGRSGDSIWGGRLAHRYNSLYQLGVSYKLVDNDSDKQEERVGGDLSIFLPFGASLYGISSYNLETEGWAEHSWELRFNVAALQFKPFYQKFQYEDFFGSGVKAKNPFIFLRDTNETLEVVGGDVVWPISASWELGARFKYYDYDKRGDTSDFTSLLVTWHGQKLTSVGGELGMMQGDAAENEYLLARAYFYYDQLSQIMSNGFVTGDVVYVDYDEPIYGDDTAWFVSLGAGHRFLEDRLELKVSGDYSSDPFFDEDVRGMLVASYKYGR